MCGLLSGPIVRGMEEEKWEEEERVRTEKLLALTAIEKARHKSTDYHPATFTAPDRAVYLLEVETHGGLARAANVAGCSTTIAKVYAARVPDFGVDVRDALSRYRDSLVTEATRRAVDGVVTKRFNRDGEPVGETVLYSDGLLSKTIDRADRIIGDLPTEQRSGVGSLDATLVSKLSPEGRAALRIVLSELAGMVAKEGDLKQEGVQAVIDV